MNKRNPLSLYLSLSLTLTHTGVCEAGVHSQVCVSLQVMVQSHRQTEQTPVFTFLQQWKQRVQVHCHTHIEPCSQQHPYVGCHGDTQLHLQGSHLVL